MLNQALLLTVFLTILLTIPNARGDENAKCPPSEVDISPCICSISGGTLFIKCTVQSTTQPERIQQVLSGLNGMPVMNLYVDNITQPFFIPSNFLAGNFIDFVQFNCKHDHSLTNGPISLSVNAFVNGTDGECTLERQLKFVGCNMREFNADIIKRCPLRSLIFYDSNVESIVNISEMELLETLTVRGWENQSSLGLTEIQINHQLMPRLTQLDLSFNRLEDDDIQFISDLNSIKSVELGGNNFSVVPDLTSLFNLDYFRININGKTNNISLRLPYPRDLYDSQSFKFYLQQSDSKYPVTLTQLQGDFRSAKLELLVHLTGNLDESVYYEALKSKLEIILNPDSRFECKCGMSWLLRDNPKLVSYLKNGICEDGRPFENFNPQDLSCCSTESLTNRIQNLEMEVQQLRAQQQNRQSLKEL